MATVSAVLGLAASQIGYVETADDAHPKGNVTKYWADLIRWGKASSSFQGQPWCAAFEQWTLYRNGMWFPAQYPYYVPSLRAAAQSRGVFSHTPRPGSLAFFTFGYGTEVHTGFVEKVLDATHIQTIEGNTSSGTSGSQTNGGGVYRRIRRSDWGVSGYGRPSYSTPAPAPSKLTVNGVLDHATITRWQKVNGTPVDGVISIPSALVEHVQKFLNAKGVRDKNGHSLVVDGKGIQPNTSHSYGPSHTVEALQRYYGTPIDGIISYPSSSMVKALQRALNG